MSKENYIAVLKLVTEQELICERIPNKDTNDTICVNSPIGIIPNPSEQQGLTGKNIVMYPPSLGKTMQTEIDIYKSSVIFECPAVEQLENIYRENVLKETVISKPEKPSLILSTADIQQD